MSDKTVLALRVMGASLGMGLLGDLLLRQFPWGLNIFLWLAVLAAMVVVIPRLHSSAGGRVNRWTLAAVVIFGACFAWRASVPLKLMDVFAVFVAAALASPLPGRVRVHLGSLAHYVVSGIVAGIHAAWGLFCWSFVMWSGRKFPAASGAARRWP